MSFSSPSKAYCPHCDRNGWAFEFLLEEHHHFYLLVDCHPLVEGHLLLIPKRHTSSMAAYTAEEWKEFKTLYARASAWIKKEYGAVTTFEHGVIGQTVFHSHVHLIPFQGTPEQVIPEGKFSPLQALEDLREPYLFFSLEDKMWTVDPALGVPRFFRDRFARLLNREERGNWKEMRQNPPVLEEAHQDNLIVLQKFV